MVKPLEEYTDKELENSIKMNETALEDFKNVVNPDQGVFDAIKKIVDFLKKLYEERARRREKK